MPGSVVCPGDRLYPDSTHAAGEGCYTAEGSVIAAVVGQPAVAEASGSQKPVVTISRSGAKPVTPAVGDAVLCKVQKTNPRVASLQIVCIGTRPVQGSFSAIIRSQDVRATEVDKVDLYASFRPGDIVRAVVLALGDGQSYILTTARNDLGVIQAKSLAGVPMVPISWEEMQCPQTAAVEKRKVAKVA